MALCVLWAACSDLPPTVSTDAGPPPRPPHSDGSVGPLEGSCPDLFAQDELPEWRMTISDTEWAALEDEFLHIREREAAGLDKNPYHPVESITFDDGSGPVEVPRALVRLKGEYSWIDTITNDVNPKMQFLIAFNEIDPAGRFHGVRKVELDMPRDDETFLRQRMALYIMRQVGQDAQCANSATLSINGQYYGLYTQLERIDKEFLQRIYGKRSGADDGDLWKEGRRLRTNKDSATGDRLEAFWNASSVDELSSLADLEEAVHEWASEAILPDGDGYQIGLANYFLYDHPARGFLWLPTDLDDAFDLYPADADLAFPSAFPHDYEIWAPYATVLADPGWMGRYVAAIAELRAAYDADELARLLRQWAMQIADPARADPHRPFTVEEHELAIDSLAGYLRLRAGFIDDWLRCRGSGDGPDADGDGVVFCFDCDDNDPALHPGQVEACNGIDDDCDGFLDEGPACP